jgi:hypothetical protein
MLAESFFPFGHRSLWKSNCFSVGDGGKMPKYYTESEGFICSITAWKISLLIISHYLCSVHLCIVFPLRLRTCTALYIMVGSELGGEDIYFWHWSCLPPLLDATSGQ